MIVKPEEDDNYIPDIPSVYFEEEDNDNEEDDKCSFFCKHCEDYRCRFNPLYGEE